MFKTILKTIKDLGETDRDTIALDTGMALRELDTHIKQLKDSGYIDGRFSRWGRDATRLYAYGVNISITPSGLDYLRRENETPTPQTTVHDIHISGVTGSSIQVGSMAGDMTTGISTVADFLDVVEDTTLEALREEKDPGVIEAAKALLKALKDNPTVVWAIKKVLSGIGIDLA